MTSPDNKSTVPEPKLRWFQYRLSTLLLLITAAAIWLSFWTNRVRQQREVVEFITRHGGSVAYSYQVIAGSGSGSGGTVWKESKEAIPPGPAWLRNLLGIDYLDHVNAAYFDGYSFADSDLEHLKGLPDLDYLRIVSSNVTDAGLVNLKYLHHLKNLELTSEKVTDAGLVHLQPLTELTELTLGCSITDACVEHLMPLKNMSKLKSGGFPPGSEKWRAVEALPTPTKIECFNLPLQSLCEYLGLYHNMKIQIDKAALKAAKIDVDGIAIDTNTKNVPLDVALHSLLDPFDLDWCVGQDGLVITTKEISAKKHQGVEKLQKALPNLKQAYVDW